MSLRALAWALHTPQDAALPGSATRLLMLLADAYDDTHGVARLDRPAAAASLQLTQPELDAAVSALEAAHLIASHVSATVDLWRLDVEDDHQAPTARHLPAGSVEPPSSQRRCPSCAEPHSSRSACRGAVPPAPGALRRALAANRPPSPAPGGAS